MTQTASIEMQEGNTLSSRRTSVEHFPDLATANDQTFLVDEPSKDITKTSGKPIEEKEVKEEKGNPFVAYKQLWSYTTNLDIALRIVGVIAACAAGTALPLMTLVFGRLVNTFNGWAAGTVTPDDLRASVNHFALYFVYLFIAKFSTVYIHTCCFNLTATRATRNIRYAFIKALLRQDISYFDNCSPGSVATQISNNADTIQTGLGEKVGVAIQGVSMLISAFVVAFISGWKLTLVTATTLPAVVIAITITVVLDGKLESKISDIYTKAAGLAEEALSSVRNVTALGANAKFHKRYDTYLDQAKGFGVKKGPVLGVQYSSEYAAGHCAYALCFFYGVRLFTHGELQNGGQVITVLFAVLIGTNSMASIAPAIGDFTEAGAAAVSVLALIAQEPKIDSAAIGGTQLGSDLEGHLIIDEVTFAYPARPTMNVLNKVSMVFEAKKTTAIVGASGSGKSTLVALTERWYDPATGNIQLDGQDIKNINVKSLRSQIGLVQQEPTLFNDSIYNNVAHGLFGTPGDLLPEVEKRKLVREACIEANAAGFIEELPEKYDTKVGERGGSLSGGQKQRLAIARSIIKNPKILLLDEATSALDPAAEGIVQAALDKVSRTRTTILIAHKLSTVKKADKIVVLNRGKLIEEGTHESLLRAKGAYFDLVAAQNLNAANSEKDDTRGLKTEDYGHEQNLELETTKTGRSVATIRHQAKPEDVSRKLSILKCLSILLYERRSLWALFLAGLFSSALGAAVFPAQAIIFSRAGLVFQYSGSKLIDEANFWALMFFMLAIATFVSYAGVGFFLTIAAFLSARVYRSEYFAAMLRQDIEYHDTEGNSSGALTSNLSTDPANLQETLSSNLCLILIAMLTLLSTCTLALVTGWKLALVAIFGCLPVLIFAGFAGTRLEEQSQDRNAKLYAESARFAAEAVSAIRTVSSLTLEDKVAKTYGDMLDITVKRAFKHIAISMFFFGLAESLDLMAMGLAFWYGGTLLSRHEYSAQTFFVIYIAIIYGGQAAGLCFGFSSNTTKFHSGANHIIHLRSQQPSINSSTGLAPNTKHHKMDEVAIEFSNVHFSYPTRPDVPILRGLNLKILHGQNIGIVGASGCGKTTIIALLERFYDIHKGSIHIHTQPLQSLDVHLHREIISLVSQDTTLYEGTIRDNILLGVKEAIELATPEAELQQKVVTACKSADIHDFIMSLPEGYSTPCGSRGLALSGGQRQRIAIARALIRGPSILLLDEATSALDTQSEEVVQRALEKAGQGRTTVAVAHRLSTVKKCDKIFVLVKGVVRKAGTHEELVGMRGVYWEMVQGQGLDVNIGN